MDDTEALKLLIKKKELGITDDELASFKESFNRKNQVHVPEMKPEDLLPSSPWDEVSEEELQYFATPYYDELLAKKQRTADQIKEDEALK